jgi:hypothetical protein
MAQEAPQAQPQWQVPAPLPARVRPPRRPPTGRTLVRDDIGFLEPIRAGTEDFVAQRQARVDLDEARAHLQYLNAHRPPPAPRVARALPAKQNMGDLYNAVATGQQDIRLIKDAQSRAGAENYIVKHGLQDHLYVDDRDIDGDAVPDIIVRTRAGDQPYIVKGYTTEKSSYPFRNLYYTQYPTAEDRRGHSFRDFVDERYVAGYRPDGQERAYNPIGLQFDEVVTARGYKSSKPKPTLTYAQAFKRFIMKPVMKNLKKAYKEALGTPIVISPEQATRAEASVRTNLILVPAMKNVYGDQVMQVQDPTEWQKLSQRKQVREVCQALTGELIRQRVENANELVSGVMQTLQGFGVNLGAHPDNAVVTTVMELEADPEFTDGRILPPA